MSEKVSLKKLDEIAVITVNNPPVNVLSAPVRQGLKSAIDQASSDGSKAIILHCEGRTFFAGADISEFGKPQASPLLPELINRLENFRIPIVAAIHGTTLGGGLELALACHYRVARVDAKLGLPEVTLGILPGAGGTQRVPRLVGVRAALDLMTSGKPISASEALNCGLVDRLTDGDILQDALAWTRELLAAGRGPRPTSENPIPEENPGEEFFTDYRAKLRSKYKGRNAPLRIVDCVENGMRSSFQIACEYEREVFNELVRSDESASLRHVFFAERQAARPADLPKDVVTRSIKAVGVVGAGTMGGGIAMCCANAGIPVVLLEENQQALDKGLEVCRNNYARSVAGGRFTQEAAREYMDRITGTLSYDDLKDADLVIEAVFENLEIKKSVFRNLDAVCKTGAILASNTSYQDINEIAAVTTRPGDVLGMHFFSPANVMKLLEVVQGDQTSSEVLATTMQFARTIRKVPVVARVCNGFIGNRMLEGYFREAQMLLLEGLSPAKVDSAMETFGMAMGPLAVADLAGLDVGYKARQNRPDGSNHPCWNVSNQLVEMGRLGQKTGAGFYRYDKQTRQRHEDPEVLDLVRAESGRLGITPRSLSDEEIVERLVYPLINEGANILQEGIARQAGDIDIVYIYGYGFPAWRGGPMFYARTVGFEYIYNRICEFRDGLNRPEDWRPSKYLESLIKNS